MPPSLPADFPADSRAIRFWDGSEEAGGGTAAGELARSSARVWLQRREGMRDQSLGLGRGASGALTMATVSALRSDPGGSFFLPLDVPPRLTACLAMRAL